MAGMAVALYPSVTATHDAERVDKGNRTMKETPKATEIMRVEKTDLKGAHMETQYLSLLNDGRIRKSVKTAPFDDGSPLCWETIGTTLLNSKEWLALVRDFGFEATNKVHALV